MIDWSQLQSYATELVPPRHPRLTLMEEQARERHFPIIGPACGQLCYLVARLMGARSVFELGSGYGYSTAWFAQAVRDNGGGVVHHVVWDDDLSKEARGHIEAMGLSQFVQFHVGEAVATLRGHPGPFDLIFNDIDKEAYPTSLPVIEERLRLGGALIIDNMIWHGQILDPNDREPDTLAIREFTTAVTTSPNWAASLIPLRDGMIVAMKAK